MAEARRAFDRVRADDERATSPGDVLRDLLNEYGPALILIDEWVAYARQLHDQGDLPGGSFETHFTFAQALTESAKLAKQCLLVVSLPASDTTGSPHAVADDVEVGGERGAPPSTGCAMPSAVVESSWRPASAEEGFEIVRRRLFEPITSREQFVARDAVARAFFDLYRTQQQEFPPEAHDRRVREAAEGGLSDPPRGLRPPLRRLVDAGEVPAHPWRAAPHGGGDPQPLGEGRPQPADHARQHRRRRPARAVRADPVPLGQLGARSSRRMSMGQTRCPAASTREVPNLGKYAAARRVARTIYLGSAPTATAANRGLEDRRIRLGCVMPGESPAIFGDALRRLATAATYLYQDGPRYWYSTQPTVTKLAEDIAEQLRRDPDKVVAELDRRLREDLRTPGDFARIHPLPASGQDVADDLDARLVVLGPQFPFSKEGDSPAEAAALKMLQSRGNAPRLFQNALVFLAVDQTRLQDLDEAIRRYLAWASIIEQKESLDLSPHQLRQAETQRDVGRRDGGRSPARGIPVAACAGAGRPKRTDAAGRRASDRPGPARCACEQEAADRTSRSLRAWPARGCGWSWIAFRSGGVTTFASPGRRGLRPLHLPAARHPASGSGRGGAPGRSTPPVEPGLVRLRRQL